MITIKARNVHQALVEGCYQMEQQGERRQSRNGPVLQLPGPLTTQYERPTERVVFWPQRDANPYFHFFESLWMLAGRNDVAYLEFFNSKIGSYSDDGLTFNAAYGYRWRVHFGIDQLRVVAAALQIDPTCRRQVVQIWDARRDFGLQSKDLACNTQVYFQRNIAGALEMMVCNRSNDLIWGAYGANAVHFSFLQEYVAGQIGCDVGKYWQVSMNTHLYTDKHDKMMASLLAASAAMPAYSGNIAPCPYELGQVKVHPLMSLKCGRWERELIEFMGASDTHGYDDPFFENVARPMMASYKAFKTDSSARFTAARHHLMQCAASDWQRACMEWLNRREQR